MKRVTCPYCWKEPVWVENKVVYGKNYGKSYMMYYCKKCDAYVGCHNNTKEPLGTLADAELRDLRKQVHNLIDPLWQSGEVRRRDIYQQLSDYMGFSFHTGEATKEDCLKVINDLSDAIKLEDIKGEL